MSSWDCNAGCGVRQSDWFSYKPKAAMLTLSMLQVTFLGVSFLPRCTDGYGGLVFTSFLAQKVFTVGGLHYVRGYPWVGYPEYASLDCFLHGPVLSLPRVPSISDRWVQEAARVDLAYWRGPVGLYDLLRRHWLVQPYRMPPSWRPTYVYSVSERFSWCTRRIASAGHPTLRPSTILGYLVSSPFGY